MAERPSTPGPSQLAGIWVGMPVIDATGRLVGSVKYIKRGTPTADHPTADRPYGRTRTLVLTMRAYRTIWSSVAGLVVLTGATLALATTPPFVSLLLFLTIGTCAGVLRNLHLLENAAPPPSRAALLRVATDVVVAGSAGLACYGFGGSTGLELPAVMVGLTLTSPPAIMLIHRLLGSSPAEPGVTERWVWTGSELAGWSDTELYSVWCATDNEVLRTTQSHQAATAVRARQHLLSEIERRHPAKTSVWLASEAALNGAPPRFLISASGS